MYPVKLDSFEPSTEELLEEDGFEESSLLLPPAPPNENLPALTTPKGTFALPPPKLATRGFVPPSEPLGTLLEILSPNLPIGSKGAASAPSSNRPILSLIEPLAPEEMVELVREEVGRLGAVSFEVLALSALIRSLNDLV